MREDFSASPNLGASRSGMDCAVGGVMMEAATYPVPPNKPDDESCCHRGCCPCIFDYYWDALARWEQAVREMGGDPDVVLAGLGR